MKKSKIDFLWRLLSLFVSFFLLSFQAEAEANPKFGLQSELTVILENQSALSPQGAVEDWKLAADKDGVQIHYKKSDCSGEPVLLLKFVNANSYTVKIEWDEFIQFADQTEIKIAPIPFLLELKPGIIQGESCSELQLLQLVSRPNHMYSIFHTANSKDDALKSIPNFEINSYRIDNLSVNRK